MPKQHPSDKPEKKELKKPEPEKTEETEFLDGVDLPPEVKKFVETSLSVQRFSGPMPSPLMTKINEDHISKILELTEKEEENEFKNTQSNRKYKLVYFVLALILIVFLTVFLVKDNKDLYLEIVKYTIAGAGGFGGGVGYSSYKQKKEQ